MNPGPAFCEATVVTTTPPLLPAIIFVHTVIKYIINSDNIVIE